jgi:hypothetical protein
MPEYEVQTLSLIVKPRGEPIFSERATTVTRKDEAAGEFVAIGQDGQTIRIDRGEWGAIKEAVDRVFLVIAECR